MKPWIGCEIKLLRSQLGWSRVQLSKKLGCSPLKMVKLEGDELIPTKEEKSKLQALALMIESQVESHMLKIRAESVMADRGLEQIHIDDIEAPFISESTSKAPSTN